MLGMPFSKLREIWAYRELIYAFVARDLKVRYRGSVLGFLWSFLDPLINAAVLWVVFTFLFARGIDHFALFLLVGILPWNFFASSVSQGSRVFTDNAGLVKKIKLPREVFPISTVIANLIHFFFAFVVLVLFLLVFKVPFNPLAWLFFPLTLVLLFIVNVGGTLLTSSISIYFRDFPFIVESGLRVLFFATPIFYSPSFVPEQFRHIYLLNPLASGITALREVFMEGKVPDPSLLVLLFISALFAVFLGWFIFSRLEKGFAEEL